MHPEFQEIEKRRKEKEEEKADAPSSCETDKFTNHI